MYVLLGRVSHTTRSAICKHQSVPVDKFIDMLSYVIHSEILHKQAQVSKIVQHEAPASDLPCLFQVHDEDLNRAITFEVRGRQARVPYHFNTMPR